MLAREPAELRRGASTNSPAARLTCSPGAGRVYWDAAPSQWYAEPKRLSGLGCLEARTEPGRTRPRTHYTLTDKGRAALAEWGRTPTGLPRMQQEPIVRLLAADLVSPDAVLEGLRPLREELEAARRHVAERQAAAPSISPGRARLLEVNHRYALRLLDLQLEWLADAERLLNRPD